MSERSIFVQRVGLVGMANLAVSLSSVILLPILTKNLSIEDYGVWAQVTVTIVLISIIVTLGMPYTMVRFLAAKKNKEEIQEGFYSTLIVILLSGTFASALIYLSSVHIASLLLNDNLQIARILPLIVLLECLIRHLSDFFRTFQKIKMYSLILVTTTYFNVILVAYLVISGHGILGAIMGLLVSRFLVFLIMIVIVVRVIGVRMPRFTNIRDYMAFGLPIVPWNLSNWITSSGDRYVIGIFLGVASVGYYTPAYILGFIISMFSTPLSFMLPVILSKAYDESNMDEVKAILRYSLKYFLALAIPSVFGLSILSKPLLTTLSTSEIASQGYIVTPFVALSGLLFGCYSVLYQILVLVKKTKIVGSTWIIVAALNLGLNFIFVPRLGILGAAVTTLIAYGLVLALTMHQSLKYISFDIDRRFIFKSIFSSVLMSLLILAWRPEELLSILIMVGLCGIVYVLCLFLLGGFDREVVQFFRNLFRARS